jgi:hypothetical protein
MKHVVTSRAVVLMTATAIAVITACGDSGTTRPSVSGPNAAASNGPGGGTRDTAKTGGPRDSSGSHTPAPTPVSKFTLLVHVGFSLPTATDSLTTDPVANATVTVYEQTITFVRGVGGDTAHINMTPVATASSDASGNVTFPNLKGAAQYLVKAEPPQGSTRRAATTFINQAYSETIRLSMTLGL